MCVAATTPCLVDDEASSEYVGFGRGLVLQHLWRQVSTVAFLPVPPSFFHHQPAAYARMPASGADRTLVQARAALSRKHAMRGGTSGWPRPEGMEKSNI